jgi:hypothetical protein
MCLLEVNEVEGWKEGTEGKNRRNGRRKKEMEGRKEGETILKQKERARSKKQKIN